MKTALLSGFAAFFYAGLAFAQQPPTASAESFYRGLNDRAAWEAWMASIPGIEHDGADYWAAQRSLPHPAACVPGEGRGPEDYYAGCMEAQKRLAVSDALRRSNPTYKAGWNSYRPGVSSSDQSVAQAAPSAPLLSKASDGLPTNVAQPSDNGTSLPDGEVQFCSIIENATAEYKALGHDYDASKKQQNGIRTEIIEHNMTSIATKRNNELFQYIRRIRFLATNWIVDIVKIDSLDSNCHTNMPSCIRVDVHLPCSSVTMIHTHTLTTPAQLQFLGEKQHGDQLTMSGTIVAKFGGAMVAASPVIPTSPDDLEGSFRESGSMTEPEYNIDVRQWR